MCDYMYVCIYDYMSYFFPDFLFIYMMICFLHYYKNVYMYMFFVYI